MTDASENPDTLVDEEGEVASIRLDFSVSDATILTSLYISGVVLLAFMTTGLMLHRKAKDKRLHLFSSSNLFAVHLAGCMFMGLCGLVSVYARNTLFHSFNAFALFLLVIFYNHLGCSKYSYIRTVSVCCARPRKSLLFRLIYFTENKYNLALSGSLVFLTIMWWMYYSLTIEDPTQRENEENLWSEDYVFFLLIMYAIVVFHTGIASVYSKISLAVFCVLFPLFLLCFSSAMYYSGREEASRDMPYESLLVYWFVLLFAVVSSVSFFACSKELKLQLISISLVGGFLSIFDLLTDLVLIITWFNEGYYGYVVLQVIFIGSGTIYSSVFITRFYFDKDGKEQYIGQTLTLIGLGRLWHGILAWDMDNHSYVMLLGNKMIKIWEMFLESYPSIFLQLWIVLSERDLKSESNNPVIWSLVVSVSSITFTVFRILYFDHRSRHRNSGIFQDAVEQIDDEILRERIAMVEKLGPQQQQKKQQQQTEAGTKEIELEVAVKQKRSIPDSDSAAVKNHYPQSSMSHDLPAEEEEEEEEAVPVVFNAKMSKLQKQIAREQALREEMQKQSERMEEAKRRRREEREQQLAGAKVTITFTSKPLGCTLYRGDNEVNAWIADVRDDNPYKSKGLVIGLYVHTINYEIVDNDAYYGILTRVRDLPAPLVIGFNPYPPLNPEDETIGNFITMGFTFTDCQCAWQQINATSDTMTTKDVNFESSMLQIMTQFNQVDESVMISQYQHDLEQQFKAFELNDDAESDDASDLSEDLYGGDAAAGAGGYYYTQKELDTDDDDDDDDDESLYDNNHLKPAGMDEFGRKTSYDRFLEDNDARIGPHSMIRPDSVPPHSRAFARFESDASGAAVGRFDSDEKAEEFIKQKSVEQMQEAQFAATAGANESIQQHVERVKSVQKEQEKEDDLLLRGRTRGASQKIKNIAELIGAVERVEESELLAIKFKRKPLGFDRSAGRFGLNCRVREIHIKKLRKQNLSEGFYVRSINDRYVERLKFSAIETLLRNTPCPLCIVFRMTEPPLPSAMLAKLEERERKRRARNKLLLIENEEESEVDEEEEEEQLQADVVNDEVTIRVVNELPFVIGAVNEEDDVCLNAKIVQIVDERLLDRGVRVGMFVHAIDGMICDFQEFELISITLNTVISEGGDAGANITLSLYCALDLEAPSVRRLYHDHGFNVGEVKSAWRILNRRKIDQMNDIDLNAKEFEMEMIQILLSQREIEDNFYKKMNANRLFGLDFDPGKPITIFFEKRPLGFECESGDELVNGKNAKISVITHQHYDSIGLAVGMLIHKINAHTMDNLAFTTIASILRTHKLPMTITFTKSIALSNLQHVIKCTFGQRPFGFTVSPSNAQTGQCPAIVDAVTNKKLRIQKICKGMLVHNVNGIDVMNVAMQCDDLESMLRRLQLPIVVGFLDMDKVKKAAPHKVKKEAQLQEKPHLQLQINPILRHSQLIQNKEKDYRVAGTYCCSNKCLNDVVGPKSMHYFVFYVFTITELYCRIYPMLVVEAYILKTSTMTNVYLVGLIVIMTILSFETIAYKKILYKEYASWKTVFKQLYFATFTISFFLLSTMGLAYLERNVDFVKLMNYEFTGRHIIGFLLVAFVTMHQAINIDFDEWIFAPTLYVYYTLLLICVAAHFYLKHNHEKL